MAVRYTKQLNPDGTWSDVVLYESQYTAEEIETLLGLTSYAAGSEVVTNLMTDVAAAQAAAEAAAERAEAAVTEAQAAIGDLGLSVVDGKLCVTYNT